MIQRDFALSNVNSALLEVCRKAGVTGRIFDCGSRDALDGIALLDSLGAEELHVFECNPPSAEQCRRNASLARRPHAIVVREVAVAEHDGTVPFFSIDTQRTRTRHADGNPGASSLLRANPAYPHERYVQRARDVACTRLDTYARAAGGAPDLLWMDLQGAELMALRGCGEMLRDVKVIYTEIGFRPVYLGQALFHEVDDFLRESFELIDLRIGRWPRWPRLYRLLRTGPWIGDAVYLRRDIAAAIG